MNKLYSFVCCMIIAMTINTTIFSEHHDLNADFNTTSSQLSLTQILQLHYFEEILEEDHDEIKQHWTNDENVQILIEMTELAIQESSPTTQSIMKQRIIKIFQKFNINLSFTADNFIQKLDIKKTHDVDTDTSNEKKHHTKKTHEKSKSSIHQTYQKLEKIHGANRTRKKLEKARKEREANKKNDQLVESTKHAFFKQPTQTAKPKEIESFVVLKRSNNAYFAKKAQTENDGNQQHESENIPETGNHGE